MIRILGEPQGCADLDQREAVIDGGLLVAEGEDAREHGVS